MAKMSIGSGQSSKKQNLVQQVVVDSYDDSQLNAAVQGLYNRLLEVEAREPQIIKTETTVIEKQPEVTQHIHNVQEAKDVDLSHLLPVERYEAEFKMLNQTVNVINQSLQDVANNSSASLDKLDINLNDKIKELYKKQEKTTERFYIFKDKILENKNNLDKFNEDITKEITLLKSNSEKTQLDLNSIAYALTNAQKEKNKLMLDDINSNLSINILNKKLNKQKIINVILAIGLAISLIK